MANQTNRECAVAILRAGGGAIIFGLPLLMTMEMWWLGFHMDRLRLALFLVVMIPVLTGLAYYAGFEDVFRLRECLIDAFVAYAVAFVVGAAVLALLAELTADMSAGEIIGKIALQAVPGSIGAMLARSQLGAQSEEQEAERRRSTYHGELFTAGIGALFLAFNVAPTEEMVLIAYQMTAWHGLALVAGSLAIMHVFVYAAHFRGHTVLPEDRSAWGEFVRLTLVAYAIALLISLYVLWTFGRTEDTPIGEILMTAVVLGFPASIGAAAARLIL